MARRSTRQTARTGSRTLGPLSAALAAPPTPAERARRQAAEQARVADARAFHEKYGRSLESTERAAEGGDVDSVCRLIEWDKSWLFRPETQDAVARAVVTGDQTSLTRIGKALAKLPQQPRRSPDLDNRAVLFAIDNLYRTHPEARAYMADPKNRATLLRNLAFKGVGYPTKFLDEPRYFTRFLKRHNRL